MFHDEVRQAVLVVVFVGQFEDGFPDGQGEPDDGFADEVVVPVAEPDEPRSIEAGQLFGGGVVEIYFCVGVVLEVAGRQRGEDGAFDRFLHHFCLVLAPGHEVDALGFQDGFDAHGDGAVRYFLFGGEVLEGVLSGHGIEAYQSGCGRFKGAGLIETDVAGTADAQDLDIDAAGLCDFFLVGRTELFHLVQGQPAVGDMDVFGFDVHMVEEPLFHKAHIALGRVGLHRVVLIEVKSDDVAQAEAFLAVHAHQLLVDQDGGRARGQAQYDLLSVLLFLADGQPYTLGDMSGAFPGVLPYLGGYFFQRFELIAQMFHNRRYMCLAFLYKTCCEGSARGKYSKTPQVYAQKVAT